MPKWKNAQRDTQWPSIAHFPVTISYLFELHGWCNSLRVRLEMKNMICRHATAFLNYAIVLTNRL
jgi:hypothetical protein